MLVVLDVDETLIHSHDEYIPDTFEYRGHYVIERPYLRDFIDLMVTDPFYRVGVWSAGTYDYVHAIVDHIFGIDHNLEFVMTRDDCFPIRRDGYIDYFKPLSILGEDDVVLVDNKPDVTTDPLNQILVKDFYYDEKDDELLRLWHHLDTNRGMAPEWLCTNWSNGS